MWPLLAAAQACGCKELFSEDFSHQLDYGGVRVINPFVDLCRSSAGLASRNILRKSDNYYGH